MSVPQDAGKFWYFRTEPSARPSVPQRGFRRATTTDVGVDGRAEVEEGWERFPKVVVVWAENAAEWN
jgi:hypothetical protein